MADVAVLKRSLGEWAWGMRAVQHLFMMLPPEMEAAHLLGGRGELRLQRPSLQEPWTLTLELAGQVAVFECSVHGPEATAAQLARKLGWPRVPAAHEPNVAMMDTIVWRTLLSRRTSGQN